jgi:DNA-binding MarR family transcriptional regulator
VQATHLASEELVVSFFGVLRNLKRISPADPVDKPSLMVLHALSMGEPMRLSEAATAVCLDLSTVSRHVRTLEDGGYVRRAEDPNDRRASLLALTDEGQEVLAHSFDVRRTAIGNAIAGWSEEDRQTLTHLLTRLASDLDPRQAAQAPTES